jgi:hypothetical protein
LERQKQDLRQKAKALRAEVGRLAAAVATAYTTLPQAQQDDARLEQLDKFAEAQSGILQRELQALDALEGVNPSGPPVAILSDVEFSWDDPAVLELLQVSGGSPRGPSR